MRTSQAAAKQTAFKATLGELEMNCPSLPKTLLEAIELMNQPQGPEIQQVIGMVQHDPGVIARLLRIINSAYYGQRTEVSSVERAVVVMGTVSVTGIVMGMAMQDIRYDLDDKTALPFLNLVRHSVASAYLSRYILQQDPGAHIDPMRKELEAEVFTAALLYDVGKLVLLYNHPYIASRFYTRDNPGSTEAQLLDKERTLFGYDHVETGVYLCRRLRFPELLTTVVSLHHRYHLMGGMEQRIKQAVYTIAAADVAAAALGCPVNRGVTWEACAADPIWQQMIDEDVFGYPDVQTLLNSIQAIADDMLAYVDTIS